MSRLDTFEQTLLDGWEDVHKKSQLGLWMFLALKDGPKHMAEIKTFIHDVTDGVIVADDQSMYRALRRFKDGQMVDFTLRVSRGGPDLKQYFLTSTGRIVLDKFLERNVRLFYQDKLAKLVKENVDVINQ